ncbi:aminoacyltransferase [Faecalicoccus pleomorphus]|uniref:Aminoacyltransferase n=1 Tax=Faecalicoccus pleomorphus TaxID=1323 RepID=A0A7X9NGG1_9FIRM|nr:aminoacyltransferase [Faecalicoccus pleomorphus]
MPYVPHDLDGNVVEGDFDNRDVVSLLKKLGYRHEGFTRGIDLSREPRWIYTIPLKGKTPEELMKQFERKTVRSIKKAQKYNVQVHELSRDQIEIYEKVLKQTGERRGFQGRDDEYHRLYDAFHDAGYVKF